MAQLPQQSERDFHQQVVDLARLSGWLVYFTWGSFHSPAGFPDLVLARPPEVIIAEMKRESGKLTLAQEEWIATLRKCPGVRVYVWRPHDWDEIVDILQRR